MKLSRLLILALSLAPSASAQGGFDASLGAVIESSCLDCHSGPRPKGALDLTTLDGDVASREGLSRLLVVRNRLMAGDMPPVGKKRPDAALMKAAVTWANKALAARTAHLELVAGRTTVRRLSRAEYTFTVRDLFGIDAADLTAAFPSDDLGYGFDNIGEALTFSALHVEKFASAAEQIAARTINTEDPANPEVRSATAEELESTLGERSLRGEVHALYTNGTVTQRVTLPRKGRYLMRVSMWAQQAGPDVAKARLSVNGRELDTVEVKATRSQRGAPIEHALEIDGGRHAFEVSFVNDFYDPKNADASRRDRNMYVERVEIVGPLDEPTLTSGHRWIFEADPGKGRSIARARAVVRVVLARVWRRPPTGAEVTRLARLIAAKADGVGSFHQGVRLGVAAALVSPHFLFRVEPGGQRGANGRDLPLDAWSLATRLSYFLWSSTPDEALLRSAASRAIATREGLASEVTRMLRDPKAAALSTRFAGQWLEVSNIVDSAPDPDRFPSFDDALRLDLQRETELFFNHVLTERRPARELVGADYSFLNQRLARHYGVKGVEGDEFRKVTFTDATRGGVLGHGSIHLVTSDPTRTSPVKRGKWILENLLGTPPPPPPAGVDPLAEEEVQDAATFREQLALHRKNPMCASCHVRMDALGFALERFDPIGRLRNESGGKPIDTRGTLPDGTEIDGAEDLRSYVRDDPLFVRTLARKLFVYAIGRDVTPVDALAIEAMASGWPHDPALEDVIRGIVQLDAFRRRSPPQ